MSIGGVLAEARRQAGLTVADVSARTRIRPGIITGIENDDYSGCGGDFYARGHVRSIARAVGTDPGPLIREYDSAQRQPPVTGAAALRPVALPSPRRRRGPLNASTVLALAVMAVLGFGAYYLVHGHLSRTAPPAPGKLAASQGPVPSQTSPAPGQSQAATVPTVTVAPPVRTLRPVSVTAFGPGGAGQGDNPALAPLAIDHQAGTAWDTDWYSTAHFSGMGQGTGLLLNMGRMVTVTSARVELGRTRGASLQLRIGTTPSLARLRSAAHAADVGGAVRLRLRTPAQGRYVLLWFTALPPDPNGTFQASVYAVSLMGW